MGVEGARSARVPLKSRCHVGDRRPPRTDGGRAARRLRARCFVAGGRPRVLDARRGPELRRRALVHRVPRRGSGCRCGSGRSEARGRNSEGGVARPLLKDGVAAFHVAHMTKGQQFVLELPDGELEVRGTRFIVRVHDGRTESVQVTEGFVALRIQGDAERLLHAGDDWSRSRDRPAAITEPLMHGTEVIPTAAAPFAAPSLSIKSSSSLQPAAAPGTPTRSGGATTVSPLPISPAGSSQPVRPVSASVASESYAAAADAFRTEAYPKADALLAAFCRDFASDPRCEDAAFLRAVAHARMGDHPGAASLARAYLQSFPNGLRRREAEALAGDGGNSSRSNAGATP